MVATRSTNVMRGVDIECESAFVALSHSLTGSLVGIAHTLSERRVGVAFDVLGLEEYGAKGGRKGQGVDSREADRDSHGETKLAVEYTCGTGHERHRYEHEHHNQCNRDKSAGDFAHRVDRCPSCRRVALVELGVDGLDDHNGVVDHNRNRKHECRQGDKVDREADEVEDEECTDKGHRNCDCRDEGRAHILQEHVYHEEHKDKCLDKGVDHSVDRGVEEVVVVHRYLKGAALGQIGLEFVDQCDTVVDNLCGVRSGCPEHYCHRCELAVVFIAKAVCYTAKFDFGYVFEVEDLAVFAGTNYDVAEFFGVLDKRPR